MKIAVCVKQVPSVEEVRFDPARKTIVREGVPNEINPFDRRALGQAIALRDQVGGEVVAVTMGPPQAEEALRECLAVGVDRAVHLCDRAMAGADTLATARTLAAFLRREAFDLILCGKYSVDAETGQLGPEIAALLDMPHVTGATGLKVEDGRLVVQRETDEGIDTLSVELPALLTAGERLIRPPRVDEAMLEAARARPVQVVTASDLGLDPARTGLAGSPTEVSAITSLDVSRQTVLFQSEDPQSACARLVDQLISRGALGHAAAAIEAAPLPPPVPSPRPDRAIWVVAELLGDGVRPVTWELLGAAAGLAARVQGQVAALLLGHDVRHHVPALAAHGAEVVYVADDPALGEYSAELYGAVLARAMAAYQPWAVLVPATANGRDFAPRATAALGLGLTGDAVGLEIDSSGRLVQLKPAFGGTIIASILSKTFPQVATVRPGMLAAARPDTSRTARVVRLPLDGLPARRTRLLEQRREAGNRGIDLETAPRVVCAGNGVGRPEDLHYVVELASVLDAAVGATRRVVDAGWLPRQLQVGLTGKAIAPQLYVGVGVRGAFNHMIGLRRARTIVAINNDPSAPIMQQADFGLVGDYRQYVPALIEALRRAGIASGSSAAG